MSDEERFKQSMRKLAARLVELQDRARSLGVFPGDRELLECSHCGLMEDVLCTGQLITCRPGREGQDTGLRFEELDSDAFRCPASNTINHVTPGQEGYRPPKARSHFNAAMLSRILLKKGIHRPRAEAKSGSPHLQPDEWWLKDLAEHLHMPSRTLTYWRKSGWIHTRKVNIAGGRWIIWADVSENRPAPSPQSAIANPLEVHQFLSR